MSIGDLVTNIIIGVVGTILTALLFRIYNEVRVLARRMPIKYTHFRFDRNREQFNELGIEILNGAVSNDTVYVVLRSGTFIGDFAKAIAKLREHAGTKLVVIVPDREIFSSNFGKELQAWITDLYENPDCASLRGLLLEPGKTRPSEARMAGYLFISDGHNHDDDEGFYTASAYSAKFLHGYLKSLVRAGKRVEIPSKATKST